MSSPNLLKNEIEKIKASLSDIKNKRDKAYHFFNFAKKQLSGQGDEDIIYTNVYDSVRIACEAVLLLNGSRVKSSAAVLLKKIDELITSRESSLSAK